MKLSVNRNTVWCDLFVEELYRNGVRHVCISPGSRSTPLTLAFAKHHGIKSYVIVDERSSGFFALGIAKETKSPVAIVTTSGTAVAEIYPAIIEAYYQRIPLIICTADRPPHLRKRGANQTINQVNIYKNHIRFFNDLGLPDITRNAFKNFKKKIYDGLCVALKDNIGPIHYNFPFEKPFEPDTPTDKIDVELLNKFSNLDFQKPKNKTRISDSYEISRIADLISKKEKGIILCGYKVYDPTLVKMIDRLSHHTGYPIIADGSSSLRFGTHTKERIINNFPAMVRSKQFIANYSPEVIIQFGGPPTSNVVLDYFKNSKAVKIIVNKFGDKNDPSLTAKFFHKIDELEFCTPIMRLKIKRSKLWQNGFQELDKTIEREKKSFLEKAVPNFEGLIVKSLIDNLPDDCNLMVSNSLPIRDLDFFASSINKKINLFVNRGASGIDGINSTALGIATSSKRPTILLTGDLAFFHDLNGLQISYKYKIPLIIVLINNNGGGIFESLPISRFGKLFTENFVTSLNLEFANFVKAYKGEYYKAGSLNQLKEKLFNLIKVKKLTVIEIKTDSKKSKEIRDKYWQTVLNKINPPVNVIKNRRFRI
ncbi:MAG: 2-succinyl-5-enolpyruvyl-6-hydroxy-3-cyclohexene-1-carboxylic-acid synthase [Bacteroidota bacterium]